MTTIMASTGLVPLEAPLPAPRQFDLLSAAQLVDPTSNRWLGGAWIAGDVPGPAYVHDPCSTGTERVKRNAGDIFTPQTYRFTVYLPAFCTAQSIGPDPEFWTDRLRQVFQVYEGAAVESVLATGDGGGFGPFLGDSNMEVLGGGAVSVIEGLALLETAIAEHGSGIIHVTPSIATYWAAETLIAPRGGVMYTTLGTRVAVGAGYVGAIPVGQGALGTGQEWAFASGPVQIYRDREVQVIPLNYYEAIDRALNDVLFFAERPYLFNWIGREDSGDDNHVQAGVLIDRGP